MNDINIREISSEALLEVLPVGPVGECVHVQKEDKYLISNGEDYVPLKADTCSNMEIPLYDLNKQIISGLGALSPEGIEEGITLINQFQSSVKDNYFMLYGKEIGYFTLFHIEDNDENDFTNLGQGVISCLSDIGEIYSIENIEQSIEIWIKNKSDAITVLYLFPYDLGVCTIGGLL